MSERKHVTREVTADESSPVQAAAKRRRTLRKRVQAVPERDIREEILLDVPLQARSVEGLSRKERARYRKALCLLASEGGLLAMLRDGNMTLVGLGTYEALLARSWAIRFDDPEEMVQLAQSASELAESFDPRGYGSKRIADLQARAWGELANAYRITDKLRSSQRAFGQAYLLLKSGTEDPYLKARLFDLEASLLGKWRDFPYTLHRLTKLSGIYRDLGETHMAGRALIVRALYTFYSGKAEEAIQLNAEGFELIERHRDPALCMMAMHNHLLYLVDLGRYSQAKRALFENRQHLIYKDRINALRFRGLEGRISYGLGELVSAEIAFREVKEGLAEVGMGFYGALVTLELGMVLMSQERVEEAEQEVLFAREVFLSLEIYREFIGAVVYLEESIRRREATAELFEVTVAWLRRKELQIGPRHLR